MEKIQFDEEKMKLRLTRLLTGAGTAGKAVVGFLVALVLALGVLGIGIVTYLFWF